ncbi:MAG: phosphoglycerate dehydrogenase [Zhenhengia sp.]|uniref:D-3-phosphoglycerate dehydrogenase n=1 Tax=Zhenhengia yiwuensis TaxID=2763666 RepID=A0A926EJR8_9FIRM|nr:phosphoglycerate dehydrogenase [Zhenhengia yiwuensis]MBC8579348.1 phosphoglycerate dehydrogenase [Zhenhengia yiwuensis]MBS5798213.1 phosphoglycerate dehydrogenase [Clostridiales bacterium]MDU6360475.1 phosphoglycerate dehydrogenase [Clostridiales bacterium]
MSKIYTLNKISSKGLEGFGQCYEVQESLQDADAILVRSAKMHELELPKSVKAIARAGAGVNNIPIDACTQKGIVVFNTPGANANAVKEMVIAGLLLSSRKIIEGVNWAQTLKGNIAKEVESGKSAFTGPEILGKKLGVVGLGAIGVLVANATQALGMEVIGYDPYLSVDAAWGISRHIRHAHTLEEVLGQADYITIHAPLTSATKEMFNEEAFNKMKKGVRLLNFARDTLVDNQALVKAIEKGTIEKYVTDFPVEGLIGHPQIITIPHLGASTPESEDNCAVMAVKELKGYLEKGTITNSVNFPECEMPWHATFRLTLIHKNIPAMIGKITSIIAEEGINISDMINKSKGEWAYTIIDTDTKVTDIKIKSIEALDDMIKVRVLSK